MKLSLILTALVVLAAMVIPATADEVDDLILDLKYGTADVRSEAAIALNDIGDPRAVDPLIDALEDEDEDVQYEAAWALGDIGDPRAVDPLIEAFKDEDEGVRRWAAWALGEIGEPAIDPLIDSLKDEDTVVRKWAAYALSWIGDRRAVDPLIDALKDEDVVVREYAAYALGEIGDPRAVDPLIAALKDEDEDVQEAAADALGWIGDLSAVDPLIDALEDEDESVRYEAAWALGEIGDPRAVDPLVDALKDEDPNVQSAASDALDNIVDVTKCQWDSFTPDPTAFVGPQRGVFPLRDTFEAGSYLILVGPAGENGLDLPPASWKTFGPYELKSGHKYKATIESPRGESLLFEKDPADLSSYGDPSPGYASVYARNNCPGDVWYAICLRPINKECGEVVETEGEWIDDECLQMGEPFDICECLYLKAKDIMRSGEYDNAIILFDYIIEVITPINNDLLAQGFSSSNSAQLLAANSWLFKGAALSLQGNYEEAIQAYDEAIELDPGSWSDPLNPPRYFSHWEAKGAALEKLGRNNEAQQCFDESNRIKEAWGWE